MSDADILTRASQILLDLAGKPGADYDYLTSAAAATCALAAHDLTMTCDCPEHLAGLPEYCLAGKPDALTIASSV